MSQRSFNWLAKNPGWGHPGSSLLLPPPQSPRIRALCQGTRHTPIQVFLALDSHPQSPKSGRVLSLQTFPRMPQMKSVLRGGSARSGAGHLFGLFSDHLGPSAHSFQPCRPLRAFRAFCTHTPLPLSLGVVTVSPAPLPRDLELGPNLPPLVSQPQHKA